MDPKELQGLRVGGGRAQALRPRDRNRGGRGLGVLRARPDRSEERRRAARARRRAAAAGRVSGALGQQEREPAAGLPLREGLARRRQVLAAVRDAAGRRRGLGAAQGRPAGMGEGADLVRPRQLHDVHGRPAVPRRDLQAGEDHRGRPQASWRPALAAVRSADRRPVPQRALRSAHRHDRPARHADRGMGARVQGARSKQITDGPSCPQ